MAEQKNFTEQNITQGLREGAKHIADYFQITLEENQELAVEDKEASINAQVTVAEEKTPQHEGLDNNHDEEQLEVSEQEAQPQARKSIGKFTAKIAKERGFGASINPHG